MNVLRALLCRIRPGTSTINPMKMKRTVEDESVRERSKELEEVYELLMAPAFLVIPHTERIHSLPV